MNISTTSYAQDAKLYTNVEKEYIGIFNNFRAYIITCINTNVNVTDSAELKRCILLYVYGHARLDSLDTTHFKANELSDKQFNNFKEQIKSFYNFFYSRKFDHVAEHVTAMPSRFIKDKCVYDKLTAFQKQNTLIYFDGRYPDKVIGFLLFVPRIKNINPEPRIWSWELFFKYGLLAFRAVTGEEGLEYVLSGGD